MKGSMRKIIQISNADGRVYALCDDGTLWTRVKSTTFCENGKMSVYNSGGDQWVEHPGVPQSTLEETLKEVHSLTVAAATDFGLLDPDSKLSIESVNGVSTADTRMNHSGHSMYKPIDVPTATLDDLHTAMPYVATAIHKAPEHARASLTALLKLMWARIKELDKGKQV